MNDMHSLRRAGRHIPLVIGALGLASAWWPVLQPLQYDDGALGGLQFILTSTIGWPFGAAAELLGIVSPEAPRWLQHVSASALGLVPFMLLEWYLRRTDRRAND